MGSYYTDESLSNELKTYTWEEISQHKSRDDKWIVVDGHVYDISRWQYKHPGGARIISHFAGQDATDAWVALHKDRNLVLRYMKSLLIGKLSENNNALVKPKRNVELEQEFRELRAYAEKSGLMRAPPTFFILQLLHILALEVIAYLVLWWGSGSWPTFVVTVFILATAQAQSGWTQHDYGHLSVMPTSRLNHIMHLLTVNHLKGASSHWWNFRHNQHHSKPNIIGKDPDIGAANLFLVGKRMPERYAQRRKGFMPYDWQHIYFWLLGPPTLLTIYFHLENVYFMIKRRDWLEFAISASFFFRFFYQYVPIVGGFWAFTLYMSMRLVESHWFVMVTQMNHIPMTVDIDQDTDWVTSQAIATCNVEQSLFNDWFTGHLNFQIEHHLFPTMPRCNYVKIQPLVKSLFKKHGVDYVEKSLFVAMVDIVRSLKTSGEIWRRTYDELWPADGSEVEETPKPSQPDANLLEQSFVETTRVESYTLVNGTATDSIRAVQQLQRNGIH